jgi:hypothetical protein
MSLMSWRGKGANELLSDIQSSRSQAFNRQESRVYWAYLVKLARFDG